MTTRDDALRADIRRLGNQLGEALVRQHGEDLLDLVEEVRSLGKSARRGGSAEATEDLHDLLAKLDTVDVIPLVRAFTTYFYLANVAEQVHRIEEMASDDRYLRQTVDRILDSHLKQELLDDIVARFEVRPVFTAHPTEAARRSILTKRAEVAELINLRLKVRNQDQIDLIKAVAERVALSAENARLFEETTRRAERERLVSDITGKIRSVNDPQSMIQTAMEELRKALGASKVEVIPQAVKGAE